MRKVSVNQGERGRKKNIVSQGMGSGLMPGTVSRGNGLPTAGGQFLGGEPWHGVSRQFSHLPSSRRRGMTTKGQGVASLLPLSDRGLPLGYMSASRALDHVDTVADAGNSRVFQTYLMSFNNH